MNKEFRYKIIRHYRSKNSFRTLRTNVTKKHAMEHCANPEASSFTAKKQHRILLTQKVGMWYDTYTQV